MVRRANSNPRTRTARQPQRQIIWTKSDELKYFLFIITFAIDQPYSFLSWKQWKPVKYFVKMGEFIGEKTDKQCKSYDQRKKKKEFAKHSHLTMLQWVILRLKQDFSEHPIVQKTLNELRRILSSVEVDYSQEVRKLSQIMEQLKIQLTESSDEGIFMN